MSTNLNVSRVSAEGASWHVVPLTRSASEERKSVSPLHPSTPFGAFLAQDTEALFSVLAESRASSGGRENQFIRSGGRSSGSLFSKIRAIFTRHSAPATPRSPRS